MEICKEENIFGDCKEITKIEMKVKDNENSFIVLVEPEPVGGRGTWKNTSTRWTELL